MNKKLIKRALLGMGVVGTTAAAPIALVSCTWSNKKTYDLGIATQAISSLNYIKFASAKNVAQIFVEGLTKNAPTDDSPLSHYLNLPAINAKWMGAGGNNIVRFGFTSGVLKVLDPAHDDEYNSKGLIVEPYISDDLKAVVPSASNMITMNLNDISKWSNGDKLNASDFIDAVVYILDLNTGSQQLAKLLNFGIKNARQFIDAQNAYAKKFNKLYKNPFGYKFNETLDKWVQDPTAFVSQSPNDASYVEDIKSAAMGLGIYGDDSSSHPETSDTNFYQKLQDKEAEATKQGLQAFKPLNSITQGTKQKDRGLRISFVAGESFQSTIFKVLGTNAFLPVNRKFIESHGGIEKFGNTLENFVTLGAFNISDAVLGANGSLTLTKNKFYHDAQFVLANKIKIYFQTDINILGSLYEDEYITFTRINSIYLKKFWSSMQKRKFMTKGAGQGTVALAWNLDAETNRNKVLFDENFRKAIFYSVDREQLQKLAAWDQAVIKSNWSDQGDNDNMNLNNLDYLNGKEMQLEDGSKIPVQQFDTTDQASVQFKFENLVKHDKVFSLERAKYYIEKFKKENPKIKHVKFEYLYDSSVQGKNIGIGLQNGIKQAFGGFVELELKAVPAEIYASYISEGNFDIIYKNFDTITTGTAYAGIKSLMISDGIRKDDSKTVGFGTNPVGSWTLGDWIKGLTTTEVSDIQQRLSISQDEWADLVELTKLRGTAGQSHAERVTETNDYISQFFSLEITDWSKYSKHYDTKHRIFELLAKMETLVLESSPLIPLFTVDTAWKISRMPNFNPTMGDGSMTLDYAYDVYSKPRAGLPGEEAIS